MNFFFSRRVRLRHGRERSPLRSGLKQILTLYEPIYCLPGMGVCKGSLFSLLRNAEGCVPYKSKPQLSARQFIVRKQQMYSTGSYSSLMRDAEDCVPYKSKPQMSAILFYASFNLSCSHFLVEIAVFYVCGFVGKAFLLLLKG